MDLHHRVSIGQMCNTNSAFDGQGIYVYEYVSPKMTGALSLSQLTDEMYDRLKTDGVLTHDELTFVSHSMGGILTREFLVRYQNVTANKTRMLLFLATPMTGSEFSKLGRFSFNPQFTILVPNDDPDSFLNTLQDNWKDLHLASKSYCAYETKTSWLGQVVVEKTSAVCSAIVIVRLVPIIRRLPNQPIRTAPHIFILKRPFSKAHRFLR